MTMDTAVCDMTPARSMSVCMLDGALFVERQHNFRIGAEMSQYLNEPIIISPARIMPRHQNRTLYKP